MDVLCILRITLSLDRIKNVEDIFFVGNRNAKERFLKQLNDAFIAREKCGRLTTLIGRAKLYKSS